MVWAHLHFDVPGSEVIDMGQDHTRKWSFWFLGNMNSPFSIESLGQFVG